MAGDINPLAAAFREIIATRTVLIERFYKLPDGSEAGDSGSGVIIGSGQRFGSPHVNIATAGHVLDDPGVAEIRWCISRVEQQIEGENGVHVAEFVTTRPIAEEPMLFRPTDLKLCDIGMMSVFNTSTLQGKAGGKSHALIDLSRYPLVKTTPPRGNLLAGTRVAWCGFPGFVFDLVGTYNLCYYEGVVSAFVSTGTSSLYLVDGHVAYGVSGGPLWFCAPDGSPIVLGIVCSYACPGGDVPGLCTFTPMNTLFDRLEAQGDPRYSSSEPAGGLGGIVG